MKPNSKKFLLALWVGAAVSLTGLTGCHTENDRTAGRKVDDRMVTHHVKSSLAGDPLYKFHNVRVETYDGVVQLSGFVDTPEQKNRAAQIAQQVGGVHQVINSLNIKPMVVNPPSPTGSPTGRRIDSDTTPPAAQNPGAPAPANP